MCLFSPSESGMAENELTVCVLEPSSIMSQKQASPVCVIGLGYIGLPTAAVIARTGLMVHGVDVRPDVVDTINAGRIHIEETDLDTLVQDCVSLRRLVAGTSPVAAGTYLIAVPTPFKDDHQPDISYVLAAAESIAPVLATGAVVIVESTCPVGTTEKVRDRLAELRPDLAMAGIAEHPDVAFAYCPERVLPGKIIAELVSNDRSIGGITPACAQRAATFYRSFVKGECVLTDARTAEMVKLVENSSRDVSIAFANELSILCERLDLDVWEVIALANRHPRVNILNPGPGVGGHCIAVDPWFLVSAAPDITPLIRTAREVNDGKANHVFHRAASMLEARPGAKIACLGLAFKADVDDLRESPSLEIAERLIHAFPGRVLVVEPHITELPAALAESGAQHVDMQAAGQQADIALLLVDHREFRGLDPVELGFSEIYDTRGLWRQKGTRP
jgi:UDP-N-acetyl-D-mannosaminuronic acid dehydrogenase